MKYSILAVALMSAATSYTAQSETITYSAAQCSIKKGNAVYDHSLGSINNLSTSNDTVYCSLPIVKAKDIEKVSAKFQILNKHEHHGIGCRVKFLRENASSYVISGESSTIQNMPFNGTHFEMGPFYLADSDVRATMSCNIPGIQPDDIGSIKFNSFSVTYF